MLSLMDEWGPERVVCVSDTRTGMRGVLAFANTARGMGKGGMRMSPAVTVAEVARLARVMTYKWAGVDLFFGGAKAGIAAARRAARGVSVVPDFVANAGGVVAAGFAMDARYSAFRPDPGAVFAAVSAKMRENTAKVLTAAHAQGTTTHEAAVVLAQERVRAAMELKGRWRR
ncbi:hypothetical protein HGB48_30830 [Actinomadura latina]|uniref:Glutamate/phenylalanine/leucine/valine/L-tryptophan dehydrogenase C-terminal domain-containing protein n=1 Tax=Actinomadura latina TaxID=163603 RepID=A0A846ZCC6_9ACTN|nr:hypothetical protein [Actinomadura latina]